MKIYYSNPSNYLSNLVKVVALYADVDHEVIKITDADKEDYKANKNETGLFPYIEDGENGLSESDAIIRYIARLNPESGLYGKTLFQSAQVDELLDITKCAQMKHFAKTLYAVLGFRKVTKEEWKSGMDGLKDLYRSLNDRIKDKDYFVGDCRTLADIKTAVFLIFPFATFIDGGFRDKVLPNLTAWYK